MLFSEDFPSASRFKQTKVLKGKMTPYLAFYQADWADSWDAQTAYAAVGAVSYTHLTLPTIYSV